VTFLNSSSRDAWVLDTNPTDVAAITATFDTSAGAAREAPRLCCALRVIRETVCAAVCLVVIVVSYSIASKRPAG
jgi:hypothetical protein